MKVRCERKEHGPHDCHLSRPSAAPLHRIERFERLPMLLSLDIIAPSSRRDFKTAVQRGRCMQWEYLNARPSELRSLNTDLRSP